MVELRAVLFDLDGVLVDSHRLHYLSWQELADDLGLRFDERMGDRFRGMEREECVRVLYEEFNNRPAPSRQAVHELTERKNRIYQAMLAKAGPEELVLPGARELLDTLRKAHVTIVVASGSKNAKMVLKRAGMCDHVDIVVDRYDVTHTKPDPAIFRVALERARTTAAHAVGVEDATLGVQALHAAGIKAVGIGHYVEGADLHRPTIADLTLEDLRGLVNHSPRCVGSHAPSHGKSGSSTAS
ncbi:MAG: beta-phosphoglucomutase family hydrolase [bacterium]|nr:beta-phosphoglucomutase family hydrolase [bacterium]